MSPVARTLLFWVMMIALAMVLWKMATKSPESKSSQAMSYSDFMSCVDANNIASVTLIESQSTAEIHGQLRQHIQAFTVTIPKEAILDLTERLRKQGVIVEVTENKEPAPANWSTLLVNFSPIILIVGIWIYMMRRMQNRRNPPQQGGPAGGALG